MLARLFTRRHDEKAFNASDVADELVKLYNKRSAINGSDNQSDASISRYVVALNHAEHRALLKVLVSAAESERVCVQKIVDLLKDATGASEKKVHEKLFVAVCARISPGLLFSNKIMLGMLMSNTKKFGLAYELAPTFQETVKRTACYNALVSHVKFALEFDVTLPQSKMYSRV